MTRATRAGMPLLAEQVDDVGEFGLRGARDDVGGSRAVLAHPHVERTVEAEGKAAGGLVELHRGHPDIHHDAVDRVDALRSADLGQAGKSRLDQGQPSGRAIDQIEPGRYRGTVAVDADHPGRRVVENHLAVAAGTEGGIEIDPAVARGRASRRPRGRARGHAACRTQSCAPSRAVRLRSRELDANGPIAPRMSKRSPPCSARRAGLQTGSQPVPCPAANPEFRAGFGGLPWDFERQRGLGRPSPVRHFTT